MHLSRLNQAIDESKTIKLTYQLLKQLDVIISSIMHYSRKLRFDNDNKWFDIGSINISGHPYSDTATLGDEVRVLLTNDRTGHSATTNGYMSRPSGSPTPYIVIFPNMDYDDIRSTLIHELTHVIDPQTIYDKAKGGLYDESDPGRYFNTQAEVNSRVNEFACQINDRIKQLLKDLRLSKTPEKVRQKMISLLNDTLNEIKYNESINKLSVSSIDLSLTKNDLNDESNRRVKRALYDVLMKIKRKLIEKHINISGLNF
jgi:hypothetical protein